MPIELIREDREIMCKELDRVGTNINNKREDKTIKKKKGKKVK